MNIVKLFTLFLLCTGPIVIALLGGTWWLLPNTTWGQGLICVVGLWGFTFNKLPTKGLHVLDDSLSRNFLLPLMNGTQIAPTTDNGAN